jgi:predicted membrane-bound spermidine synthase
MEDTRGFNNIEAKVRGAALFVLILFFASGFAALLYQVIWQRMLGFFSGTDIYSATITVSAFMGGLGCGSLAGGHIADRLSERRLVLLFAISELSIALFGIASKWLYYDILYLRFPELGNHLYILAATLFISLLLPTFLMGMSLPLLSKAFTRRVSTASSTIGRLYGINTLGAAVGALVTAYIFIRYFGFTTSLWYGAALNGICGLGALCLIPFLKVTDYDESKVSNGLRGCEGSSPESKPLVTFPLWCVIYATSGFIALSLEIIWFRIVSIILKTSAYSFSIMLGTFLFGLALGTLLGVWWARKDMEPTYHFLILQTGVILYAVLSLAVFLYFVDHVSYLSGIWEYLGAEINVTSIGWNFVTFIHFVLPMVLIVPATMLMGMSFPVLQKVIQTEREYLGRRVGWLQTANIAGSMMGALLTGLIFLEYLGVSSTLKLIMGLGGIFLLMSAFVYSRSRGASFRYVSYSSAALVSVIVIGMVPSGATIWSKLHGTQVDRLVYSEDRTGVSLIRKNDGPVPFTVLSNGKGLSWIPYGGIHSVLGALPVLLHPEPKKVAVIGLGSGDTAFSAGGRPETEEITSIEITGSQMKTLEQFQEKTGYKAIATLREDPRFRHVFTDGRAYIMRSEALYDVIEIDPQDPHTAYTGNLYSYEFFDLLRRRLKPGGYAVSYHASQRSTKAFLKAFPHVMGFGEMVLIGSNSPIVFAADRLLALIRDPEVQEYYSRAGIDIASLLSPVLKDNPMISALSEFSWEDYNTDLFPRDEFMTPPEKP